MLEPSAALRSELVDAVEIGGHADALAGSKGMPFVENGLDLLSARAPDHQRLGTGGFDDGDLDRDTGFVGAEREVLRAHAVGDAPAVLDRVRLGKGQRDTGRGLDPAIAHRSLQEVHGGRSDEAGDEPVDGCVVDVERCADLLHPPLVHDDHPVRHGHYHRPCLFATEQRDAKGRIRKRYRDRDVATPYEKLKSLPEAARWLKRGVTFATLDTVACAHSDLDAALAVNAARDALFRALGRERDCAA